MPFSYASHVYIQTKNVLWNVEIIVIERQRQSQNDIIKKIVFALILIQLQVDFSENYAKFM